MRFLLCGFVLLMCQPGFAGEAQGIRAKIDADDHVLMIMINGKRFGIYQYSPELPKPFFLPVYGPDGQVITRALENPKDHPHHKGIWVSVDEVNTVDFWAEKGKIVNQSIDFDTDGKLGVLKVRNQWQDLKGKPIVMESTTITIHPNRLLSYDITFTSPDNKPVHFEDTKEGLLAFRMVDSMRESETGKVTNADGLKETSQAWGKPSAWVDYYGEVEGKVVGVALFDHPDNLRPSRYHVRNYGLFSISPFGEKAYSKGKEQAKTVTVEPGKSLRLRYGLYIHQGDTKQGKVAEVYQSYLKSTK